MMVFEILEECTPRTGIVDRLSFLCGHSSKLVTAEPIASTDLISLVDQMKKAFGFPRLGEEAILQRMHEIDKHLRSTLGRKLPALVDF